MNTNKQYKKKNKKEKKERKRKMQQSIVINYNKRQP